MRKTFQLFQIQKLTLDWDDELRDHGQHFGTAFLQHVHAALNRQETVGILLLTDSFEEDWQVVMVVQLHNIDFPENLVWWAMLDSNWQVTTIVETSKFRGDNGARVKSASAWLLGGWLSNGLHKRAVLATETLTLHKSGYREVIRS